MFWGNKEARNMAGHPNCRFDSSTQEKNTRSTVLNPRRAKFYDFQVLTGALHTVYHKSSALFLKYTRYFFQREASSKSNCNRGFRGQPSG